MHALSAARCCAVLAVIAATGCAPKAPALTFGVSTGEHDAYFLIGRGEHHALGKRADDGPIQCSSCHAAGSDSFTEFSCTGCHEHRQDVTTGIHSGIAEFRYDSASCLSCHPGGNADIDGIDDATHTREYFPIDDHSAHKAVQCSGCHTHADDRTIVTCTGCHDHAADGQEVHGSAELQAVHGQMTGYAWDTQSCRDCHAKSENPGSYDHTAFPTAAGTSHEGISCAACHATPQDRSQLLCVTCHEHNQVETDAAHADVPDYRYDSGSCVLCHAQSQVPGEIDHSTFFPIDTGATHALGTVVDNAGLVPDETIACTSCHKNPTDNSQATCLGCHAHFEDVLQPIHDGIAGYAWQDSSCLFCHPHGEPDGYLSEHPEFPIASGDAHQGIACAECHASQTDRSQLLCTSCHVLTDMEPVHRSLPGWQFDSTACFTCHAQSQVPGTFDHEPYFPLVGTQHALGAPNNLVCTDCHRDRTNRTLLDCTGCHLGSHDQAPMNTAHTGVPSYSWTPASCVGCHPNGTAAGAVFSHPYFPITANDTHGQNGIACADCHTNPADNTVVECTACHLGSHDQTPMTQRHADVPGFQWSTSQCLFCHPNSEPVGNIDHARFFPITAGSAHAGIACADCHIDPNNRQTLGCAQCHQGDTNPTIAAVHQGIPGFASTSTACLQCHPHSESVGTMDHQAYFPIGAGSQHASAAYAAKIASGQNQCSACHVSRTDRTQENCASCHAGVSPTPSSSHGSVGGFSNNSVNCKQCHGDAQVDTLRSHTVFSPTHHRAKCIDCHRTFRSDKPFAINFTQGVCTKCHSSSCTVNNRNACGD